MKKRVLSILLFTSLLALSSCGGGSSGHTNFNKADEFEINETSVEDLKTKLNEASKETAIALDNFTSTIVGKNINVDEKETSKSQGETEDDVETSESSFKFTGLNFKVEAGSKGIYSAKEAKDFSAFAEVKEISGSMKFSSKKNDEKEVSGAYKLDSNTIEFYHYANKEYIHMSAGFKTTLFGILKKVAGEENAASISAAEVLIPKNGKISVSGLLDKAEYPLMEMPGDDYESSMFDFIDVEDLLKLQNAALENGYELEDLLSFKVASDKSHFLAIKMTITKQGFENMKDLAEKTAESAEEEIELPLDIDTETTEIEKAEMIVEFDAQKRLSYLSLVVDGLNVDDQDGDEESDYQSSTIVADSNINLELNMDYKSDASKRIPNAKELEQYTEYDLSSLMNDTKE